MLLSKPFLINSYSFFLYNNLHSLIKMDIFFFFLFLYLQIYFNYFHLNNIHRVFNTFAISCAILCQQIKKKSPWQHGTDKKTKFLFTEIYRQCVENFKEADHRSQSHCQRKLAIRVEMRQRNFDSRGIDSAEDAIYERQNSPLNNVVLCLRLVAVVRPTVVAPATLFHIYSAPQREQPFNGFMIRCQEMQYLVYVQSDYFQKYKEYSVSGI